MVTMAMAARKKVEHEKKKRLPAHPPRDHITVLQSDGRRLIAKLKN
jgi:hypothetical protein